MAARWAPMRRPPDRSSLRFPWPFLRAGGPSLRWSPLCCSRGIPRPRRPDGRRVGNRSCWCPFRPANLCGAPSHCRGWCRRPDNCLLKREQTPVPPLRSAGRNPVGQLSGQQVALVVSQFPFTPALPQSAPWPAPASFSGPVSSSAICADGAPSNRLFPAVLWTRLAARLRSNYRALVAGQLPQLPLGPVSAMNDDSTGRRNRSGRNSSPSAFPRRYRPVPATGVVVLRQVPIPFPW